MCARLCVCAAVAACALIAAATCEAQELQVSIFEETAAAQLAPLECSIFGEPAAIETQPIAFSMFSIPAEPTVALKPPLRTQVLRFTADWCTQCVGSDKTCKALQEAGWQVGPGERSQIRVVDVDQQRHLAEQFGVSALPCWIRLQHGREVRRLYGHLDAWGVGRLYSDPPPIARR